jgi:hypothetical protein
VTADELKANGKLVDRKHGSTWNDGGTWYTWIYELGDKLWAIHQPTDYRSDVEVYEVERKETVVVSYNIKERD